MLQVTLSGVEIVFVLSTIIASVVFLDDFSLLIEEFALFCLVLVLLLSIELTTADIPAPDSLHLLGGPLFIVKLPFNLKHPPIFLNNDGG